MSETDEIKDISNVYGLRGLWRLIRHVLKQDWLVRTYASRVHIDWNFNRLMMSNKKSDGFVIIMLKIILSAST